MMAVEPITREEKLLDAVSTGSPSGIKPITREEMYLAYIGGQDVIPPEPITRKEQLLSMIPQNGGSGGGGGSMESGEFVGVKGSLNIPVSSKKTFLLVYPQNVNDENGDNNRISYLIANEANYQITLCHGGSNTALKRGENVAVNFTDTNITFDVWSTGIPCNTIPFYWFAW